MDKVTPHAHFLEHLRRSGTARKKRTRNISIHMAGAPTPAMPATRADCLEHTHKAAHATQHASAARRKGADAVRSPSSGCSQAACPLTWVWLCSVLLGVLLPFVFFPVQVETPGRGRGGGGGARKTRAHLCPCPCGSLSRPGHPLPAPHLPLLLPRSAAKCRKQLRVRQTRQPRYCAFPTR